MRLNNITGNWYSDEWYTDQATVDKCIELLKPMPGSTILCPFDSSKSLFVKTLSKEHNVIYGIQDYVDSTNYEYDYLVTNPPFSIKDKVIETVYSYGKKSVLVLPMDSLGGVRRHSMYQEHGYPNIYIPTRRIGYFNDSWQKRDGSNFHSIIMTFNHGGQSKLEWEPA